MYYRVMWEIDVTADSPLAAAQLAREIQLDPESIANVFDVVDGNGEVTHIDLQEEIESNG